MHLAASVERRRVPTRLSGAIGQRAGLQAFRRSRLRRCCEHIERAPAGGSALGCVARSHILRGVEGGIHSSRPLRVLVVARWYPSHDQPGRGSFVADLVAALRALPAPGVEVGRRVVRGDARARGRRDPAGSRAPGGNADGHGARAAERRWGARRRGACPDVRRRSAAGLPRRGAPTAVGRGRRPCGGVAAVR